MNTLKNTLAAGAIVAAASGAQAQPAETESASIAEPVKIIYQGHFDGVEILDLDGDADPYEPGEFDFREDSRPVWRLTVTFDQNADPGLNVAADPQRLRDHENIPLKFTLEAFSADEPMLLESSEFSGTVARGIAALQAASQQDGGRDLISVVLQDTSVADPSDTLKSFDFSIVNESNDNTGPSQTFPDQVFIEGNTVYQDLVGISQAFTGDLEQVPENTTVRLDLIDQSVGLRRLFSGRVESVTVVEKPERVRNFDVNQDGRIDAGDVMDIIHHVRGMPAP